MAHRITDANKNVIKVAGNAGTPDINTVIANFQKQIDNLESKLSKRYLTSSYRSGTTWYNLYSDGWKECGGFENNRNAQKTIRYPITFSSNPLMINVVSNYPTSDATLYQPHIDGITTTSFNVSSYGERGGATNGEGNPIYWEAKGY